MTGLSPKRKRGRQCGGPLLELRAQTIGCVYLFGAHGGAHSSVGAGHWFDGHGCFESRPEFADTMPATIHAPPDTAAAATRAIAATNRARRRRRTRRRVPSRWSSPGGHCTQPSRVGAVMFPPFALTRRLAAARGRGVRHPFGGPERLFAQAVAVQHGDPAPAHLD
jgi:hypothetical protein